MLVMMMVRSRQRRVDRHGELCLVKHAAHHLQEILLLCGGGWLVCRYGGEGHEPFGEDDGALQVTYCHWVLMLEAKRQNPGAWRKGQDLHECCILHSNDFVLAT